MNREELERLVEERARAIVREEKEREEARLAVERRRAEAAAEAAAQQLAIEACAKNLVAARAVLVELTGMTLDRPRVLRRSAYFGASAGVVVALFAAEFERTAGASAFLAVGLAWVTSFTLLTATSYRFAARCLRRRMGEHIDRHKAEMAAQERELERLRGVPIGGSVYRS